MGAGTLGNFLKNIKTSSDPNIIVGFDKSDDACVYKINDSTAVIQTVDFFPPIVDDPYTFGQIAAANALSDVYAMGGTPSTALNIMCVTDKLQDEVVAEILRGGSDKVSEAGAVITGGHTIKSQEPIYGLSVIGFVNPDKVLANSTAKPGNVIILTKPLGIGLITTAAKAGLASDEAKRKAELSMTTLNKSARDIMVNYNVTSCTDITGFGLAGHSMEMADGSNVTIELFAESIPYFAEAREYASMGLIPAGSYRNRDYVKDKISIKSDSVAASDSFYEDIIYDPQTSGGLLIAIDKSDANQCLDEMKAAGIPTAIIGKVTNRTDSSIIIQ